MGGRESIGPDGDFAPKNFPFLVKSSHAQPEEKEPEKDHGRDSREKEGKDRPDAKEQAPLRANEAQPGEAGLAGEGEKVMETMKATRWIAHIAFLACVVQSDAGEATYSSDGRHVYKVALTGEPVLVRKKVSDGSEEEIDVTRFTEGKGVVAVARDNQGRILMASGSTLWAWDEKEKSGDKIWAFEEGWTIRDVAHDRAHDRTAITVEGKTDDWPFRTQQLFVMGKGIDEPQFRYATDHLRLVLRDSPSRRQCRFVASYP